MAETRTIDVVVTRRRSAAQDVVLLDLAPAVGTLPRWAPGAHVTVVLDDGRERQYSLCSDPDDGTTWRIGVLRQREVSAWLHENARVGCTLRVRGPANHFLFAPSPGRRYVFVAGGIGITPLVPMLAAAAAAGNEFSLLYLGRSRASMALVEELEERYRGRVEVFAADEGVRLDLSARFAGQQARTVVYGCGPARLLDGLGAALDDRPPGSLHVERFAPRTFAPPRWAERFRLELLMSAETLTVEPHESVLDVLERHDVPVVSSCRVGTCGTCEVAVVDGEVEHRDSVLSPEEQAGNRSMMPCVSRACGPVLTLDL
ncbi:PDR/VanB family oxidoreductase [Isoptericola sp. NPDC019482]|uniref:PDR/VanB family oxidoreductase n=1 Tax=Isoptericola sp. NPDC019482 TaxID=3154688 RepID=UPI00346C783F